MISSTQRRADGYINPLDAEPARFTPPFIEDPPHRPGPQAWIEPAWKLAHRFRHERLIHSYGVERMLEERELEWKRKSRHAR